MARLSSVKLRSPEPPGTGLISLLPISWAPYAELAGIDQPISFLPFLYSLLIGALFAACISTWPVLPTELLSTFLILVGAGISFGSAYCTWLDIIDHTLKLSIRRDRLRPLARRTISVPMALIFYAAQLAMGLGILYSTSDDSLRSTIPLIIIGTLEPFATQVTQSHGLPSIAHGLYLSFGELVGCVAMGVDPWELMTDETTNAGSALGCLFFAYTIWQILLHSIFSYQDCRAHGQKKFGVKSLACRHESVTKLRISRLGRTLIALLALGGLCMNAGWGYYISAAGGTGLWLLLLEKRVDLKDPQSCSWWFRSGNVVVGGAITLALLGEYMSR